MADRIQVPRASLIDRAIAAVSPESALRRLRARAQYSALSTYVRGGGGHDGAKSSRRSMRGWNPGARSADRDTIPDLEDLRARSRDLERNAPLATGAIHTATNSIIGSGLRLQSQIDRDALGVTEEQAAVWQKRAEQLFALWCTQCDLTREQDFGGLQELALRSMLSSGDVFVVRRFVERKGEPFGTRLQLIEADRVTTPPEKSANPLVVDGVELDKYGAPVQYHIRNRHPHDYHGIDWTSPEWTTAPAFGRSGERQTLHLFRRTRPELHRGVPYLSPVIETLKQLDRYTDAELMAAVVSGMYTIVTYTEQGEGLANEEEDPEVGIVKPDLAKQEVSLDYGSVLNLTPGEKAEGFNPGRPNTAFDPFVMAVLRQVGVALEMPFEVLVKHFTASYSASRAALLEAWRVFMSRREFMGNGFCQTSYVWFLTEAIARGWLSAPGFFEDPLIRRAWCGSTWTGRPQGTLDPTKEAEAALILMNANVTTLAKITTQLEGGDWEQNIAQRAREVAKQRELDVLPAPKAEAQANGPAKPGSAKQAEEGDAENSDEGDEENEDA